MDKEQALEFATNTIRNIDYMTKYNQPDDFQNMIDLKDCLMCLVSNIQIEQIKKEEII